MGRAWAANATLSCIHASELALLRGNAAAALAPLQLALDKVTAAGLSAQERGLRVDHPHAGGLAADRVELLPGHERVLLGRRRGVDGVLRQQMHQPRLDVGRVGPRRAVDRSEERRVGKECASMCRSRWSPYH